MRHSLRNVALVGVLSVVGLIGLGNSTAMAQGFGGYPGGYGGGYPSGGYGSGYGSPGGFAPGVGYGAGYSVPQYGNGAYVGNGGYGGYGRGYFGGYAPSSPSWKVGAPRRSSRGRRESKSKNRAGGRAAGGTRMVDQPR